MSFYAYLKQNKAFRCGDFCELWKAYCLIGFKHLFNRRQRQVALANLRSKLRYELAPTSALEVRNLSFAYPTGNLKTSPDYDVLKNLSFTFQKSRIYCIVGRSGSGKTTFVNHLNGLLKGYQGTIYFPKNIILSEIKKIRDFKSIRRYVNIVFQMAEYQLFKDSVWDDIAFGPIALGIGKDEAFAVAKEMLLRTGLGEEFLERKPFLLSGGQKRRVAIAGILAIDPQVIIFDEPTVGLDPYGETEMIKLIKEQKKIGKTVIMISHNIDHVLEVADEVIVMEAGRIFKTSDPFTIFSDQELMSKTALEEPRVIRFIRLLTQHQPQFARLMTKQPRNVVELAKAIVQLIKSTNNER